MSGAKKVIFVMVILVAIVPLAMSENLGFKVGVDVGLGDVLSSVTLDVTPWERVSYTFGEDVTMTLWLYNSNTISLDAPVSVSGYLEPAVGLSAGMFYATVGFPIDYYPAPVGVSVYTTAGAAGDNWDADVTLDFTLYTPFSWDDVVLYGDYTFSIVTLSLAATLPTSFDSVTLSPWVDVSLGSFTVGGGVDAEVGFSPAGVTSLIPSFRVSYSF
jgi:hypothetical protein